MTVTRSSTTPTDPLLRAAAERFQPSGSILEVKEYGSGNVNDTYLVTPEPEGEATFILQRLNTRVFPNPHLVMQNMGAVTKHLGQRLQRDSFPDGRSWKVPWVLRTRDGEDHWVDPHGSFWRAVRFIDSAQTFNTIQDLDHATEVGYALGRFQSLISDLPPERLADTLPGFHITPHYLDRYDGVLTRTDAPRLPEVNYALNFVSTRRALAPVLEDAKAWGHLPVRPIHGDPKVNNIMIDQTTRRAVSMIDLDTVKPGLTHYDVGDCLRSGCNPLGENVQSWEEVRFETDFCRAILQGYFSEAKHFLTGREHDYFYEAIRLLAFELGLRFFTDYLEGNVYFKVKYEHHNLKRALIQFKLTESIERQESLIRSILKDLR